MDNLKQQLKTLGNKMSDNNQEKEELKRTNEELKDKNTELMKRCDMITKHNEELQKENNSLSVDKIDRTNEEGLNELTSRTQNRIIELQHNLKKIQEAKDRLVESQLYCMICLKNKKNIFIQGCNHFVICDECESKLESKVCPQCQLPFISCTKLNV